MSFVETDSADNVKNLSQVRVIAINEDSVDIHAFFTGSMAKFRNIPFYNIKHIKLIANKQAISQKYKVNRWHLLDVAEIGE